VSTVSTETAAFIAGGAGVLGALAGALGGGAADYALERRQSRIKARAGARLVRSALQGVAEALVLLEEDGKMRLWMDWSIPAWDDYADVLATAVDARAWTLVDEGVRLTRSLHQGMERMDKFGNRPRSIEVELGQKARDGLPMHREKVRLAYNSLSRLAQGKDADAAFGGVPKE
jgi:hypothetical protein